MQITEPRRAGAGGSSGSLPRGRGLSRDGDPQTSLGSPVPCSVGLLGECGGNAGEWVCEHPSAEASGAGAGSSSHRKRGGLALLAWRVFGSGRNGPERLQLSGKPGKKSWNWDQTALQP